MATWETMIIHTTLGLLVFCALGPSVARAECRASAAGQRSIAVTLSPASGVACLRSVRVFTGDRCGGAPLWSTTLGCSETRRMVVTDDGQLVALLAERASRRNWEIVRVFAPDAEGLAVRVIRLEDLPGLPEEVRRPHLHLDARVLRIEAEPAVTVEVQVLATLGRTRAHRRMWR